MFIYLLFPHAPHPKLPPINLSCDPVFDLAWFVMGRSIRATHWPETLQEALEPQKDPEGVEGPQRVKTPVLSRSNSPGAWLLLLSFLALKFVCTFSLRTTDDICPLKTFWFLMNKVFWRKLSSQRESEPCFLPLPWTKPQASLPTPCLPLHAPFLCLRSGLCILHLVFLSRLLTAFSASALDTATHCPRRSLGWCQSGPRGLPDKV